MPTLHTIYRCGVVSHVAIPKTYNIAGLLNSCNGGREKTYSINSGAKKKIGSSLAKMWHERRNNLTFLTFTFKNDLDTQSVVCDQKIMNKFFSSFIDNFKKTYSLHSYLWVSERTKNNAVHYHMICDFPKLKKERYVQFENYFKAYFKDYLFSLSFPVLDGVQYSSIGLPSKYDLNGVYRGSCVRSMEAVQAYVSSYLKKSDRIEKGGRIYAISRNILEVPVKTFSFHPSEVPIFRKKVYEYEFCSVDYYCVKNLHFDNYFLRKRKQKVYVCNSDIDRNLCVKMSVIKHKSIVQFENLAIKSNYKQSIIDAWDWSQIFAPLEYNCDIQKELQGSIKHVPFRHFLHSN